MLKVKEMTKEEHLALLRSAIDANLTARVEHAQRLAKAAEGKPCELKIVYSAEFMANWNPARSSLEDIVEDAVVAALRKQLTSLGKQLYKLVGSTDIMGDIADEVAGDKHWHYRIDLLSKNWDGIGSGDDRWYA
jgi:hypothetical protein